jgi:UV DNA damage endonuclease
VQRRRRGERKAQTVAVPPLLDQHADFVPPWDLLGLLRLLDRPCDVMVEAKAKDLAISYLRTGLLRVAPEVAAAEERHVAHAGP